MSDDYIKKALEETAKQIGELFLQKEALEKQEMEIDRKIFNLTRKATGLAALCDDLPADSLIAEMMRQGEKTGLTQSVRNILSGTGEWMTPAQLRDYMIRARTDLTRYKNPLGSIHTILGRFVESGEVERDIDKKTQKTVFRWKPPAFWFEEGISKDAIAAVLVTPKTRKKRVVVDPFIGKGSTPKSQKKE